MPGALGLEGGLPGLAAEAAGQKVLEGDALAPRLVQPLGEPGFTSFYVNAHLGGGGEGIPLDVVNGQDIARELVAPSGVLVGGIAPPVNPGEQAA